MSLCKTKSHAGAFDGAAGLLSALFHAALAAHSKSAAAAPVVPAVDFAEAFGRAVHLACHWVSLPYGFTSFHLDFLSSSLFNPKDALPVHRVHTNSSPNIHTRDRCAVRR